MAMHDQSSCASAVIRCISVCRSNVEISQISHAILQGVGDLKELLQDQAVKADSIIKYCQALQKQQVVLTEGQELLINGQKELSQDVKNLHLDMKQRNDRLME